MVTYLSADIDIYMNGDDIGEADNSGKEKIRKHRIDIYKSEEVV